MSSSDRDRLRETVRTRIEEFRRTHGEKASDQQLHDYVLRDASSQGWDATAVEAIEELLEDADVDIEVHVNWEDDEPPGFAVGPSI